MMQSVCDTLEVGGPVRCVFSVGGAAQVLPSESDSPCHHLLKSLQEVGLCSASILKPISHSKLTEFALTDNLATIRTIVGLLGRLRGLSPYAITKNDSFKLPRLIPAGDGGVIQINDEIDELITQLARAMKDGRPGLSKTVKLEEWRSWVRSAIGPALAKVDLSATPPETEGNILAEVDGVLTRHLSGLKHREHAFGSTLFSNADIPRFDIGPVTIEIATDWLVRKTAEGDISAITARRVESAWAGGPRRPRKDLMVQLQEEDILNAVGGAPYVLSVSLPEYAANAGLEAAAIAARLALASIALLWTTPTSVMKGFRLRYDGPIFRRTALTFVPGVRMLAGSSIQGHPHGPMIAVADWRAEWWNGAAMFSAAGDAIAHRIDPFSQGPRVGILSALAQALWWFRAGCTEESDEVAVVNFSACLDALSGGRRAGGITEMLGARLGIKASDAIRPNGPSLRSSVEKVYNEGRSRTMHGTSVRQGHDWTETRLLAEQLSRHALIRCLDLAGNDRALVDVADLRA